MSLDRFHLSSSSQRELKHWKMSQSHYQSGSLTASSPQCLCHSLTLYIKQEDYFYNKRWNDLYRTVQAEIILQVYTCVWDQVVMIKKLLVISDCFTALLFTAADLTVGLSCWWYSASVLWKKSSGLLTWLSCIVSKCLLNLVGLMLSAACSLRHKTH